MARVCQITRVAGQNWNPDDMKRVKLAEKKRQISLTSAIQWKDPVHCKRQKKRKFMRVVALDAMHRQ